MPRCLIPGFRGARLSPEHKEALWDRFLTGAPRPRTPSEQRYELTQASIAQLSRTHGLNPKTVAKWKRRTSVEDRRTGPREPRSSSLTAEQEAVVVAFRRHTLLPLDDCLYALQATIPHLTRSSLHRCLSRHGISRLPEVDGDKPARRKFKRYPIGCFHIDIAERRDLLRQARALRRRRSNLEVRLRAPGRARRQDGRGPIPARPGGGRALPDPHRAHRQRHPVHQSGEGRSCLRAHLRPALATSTASSIA